MILQILTFPDTRLAQKSSPVTVFDDKLALVCANMLETMYDAPGIGLAAPQVNIHKQIVVMDIDYETDDNDKIINANPRIFINPIITKREGSSLYQEGCLSVPGAYEEVERSAKVWLDYQDLKGNNLTLECEGLLSTAIQHELDHLDGRLFIDRLSFVKKKTVKKRLLRAIESGEPYEEQN
jgi:peptide deformylase